MCVYLLIITYIMVTECKVWQVIAHNCLLSDAVQDQTTTLNEYQNGLFNITSRILLILVTNSVPY